MIDPSSNEGATWFKVEIVTGVPGFFTTLDNESPKICFVGRFIFLKADVTIDPEYCIFWIYRSQIRIKYPNLRNQDFNKSKKFRPGFIVSGPVCMEPFLMVVFRQIRYK